MIHYVPNLPKKVNKNTRPRLPWWNTGLFHPKAVTMVSRHTCSLESTLGDVGSGSDVDKVGVLGSSWGLEQRSSASDVISVRTTASGQVSVIARMGLGNTKGKKSSTESKRQFHRPLHFDSKCVLSSEWLGNGIRSPVFLVDYLLLLW